MIALDTYIPPLGRYVWSGVSGLSLGLQLNPRDILALELKFGMHESELVLTRRQSRELRYLSNFVMILELTLGHW